MVIPLSYIVLTQNKYIMNFYHHGCHTEPICSPQPCHHTVNQLDCILDKMTAIQ